MYKLHCNTYNIIVANNIYTCHVQYADENVFTRSKYWSNGDSKIVLTLT